MKPLGIKIVNAAKGKQIALGHNTQIIAVFEDEGAEDFVEIDISNVCRAADVRLHYGEVVTATLEVFLTGIESRAIIEELIVTKMKPRKRSLWRRLRDATTFGSTTDATEYVR